MSVVAQLENVSKSYFGDTRVLDQVSLQLTKGDFVYVVGGSGAGKTSLLKIISGEETPSSGQVRLFGYDLASASSATLTAIRRCVGTVPQDLRLIADLSVADNIALALRFAGQRSLAAATRSKIDEIIGRLALGDKRDRFVRELSGGEAQRVAVARALVRSPELIIADEPTGSQDRDQTWNVMELLLKANLSGSAIMIATHDREIVRRVRKRCVVLKSGQLSFEEGATCSY